MNLRKVFLWSMVASLGLDALLGIMALLLPAYGPGEQILGSAALFAAFSLAALLCAIVLERRRLAVLMWTGIGCSAAAVLFWLVLVWFEPSLQYRTEETITRFGGTFTTAAIIIGQCGLLSLLRIDLRWARAVRVATFAASAALGACIVLLIWTWPYIDYFMNGDDLLRMLGVMAILAMCGTVVTPILWKVQAVPHTDSAESIPSRLRVSVVCPRCGTSQELQAGPGKCATCGLRIAIEIEEPRCACGYLLHRLQGDRCPECGSEIPEADRWAASAPLS